MTNSTFRVIGIGLILLISLQASAQWNAVAGYKIRSVRETNINQLIQAFNTQQPDNSLALKDVDILHGFAVGLRYGYEYGAFELLFNKSFTRRIGDFYKFKNPDTGLDLRSSIDLYYDIKQISLGTEIGSGFVLGGSIDYDVVKYELDFDNGSLRDLKSSQNTWGSTLYAGLHLANTNRISFSIRAFYQWYWDHLELGSVAEFFSLPEACDGCVDRPHMIGLSVLINNGLQ